MSNPEDPAGPDSRYLSVTAEAYGWTVTWSPDAVLTMAAGPVTALATFTADGTFRSAGTRSPHGDGEDLDFRGLLDLLERRSSPLPPPEG
ncbi:hypothetical protein [Kitasatospora sp. NPDC057223]|uniref:hypothetical protein n=1 Tax=Kitasatospora sp. NPDC057223 TaxID=3346055 RepID=UPI003634EE24